MRFQNLHVIAIAAILLALSGCAASQPQPKPFTGAPLVKHHGLQLQLTSLDSQQSVSLKDGVAKRRLLMSGYVQADDGGVGFTTERGIRIAELRDDQGRDLLAPNPRPAPVDPRFSDDPKPSEVHRFTRPVSVRNLSHGHRCFVTARLEDVAGPVRRISTLRGEVRALCITATRTFDVPLLASDDPQRYVLRELAPGLWFSLDDIAARGRRATVGYRYWLCNDVPPEQAGKPEVGTRRRINEFLGVTGNRQRTPGFTGHDPRRPPFLQQVEIVDADGKVLAATDWGTVEIALGSGIYAEFNDPVSLASAAVPVGVRVTVITDVEEVVIPFELHDVPLEDAAAP